MSKDSEFLSVQGAAKELEVSDRQVRNLIANGTIKAEKIGRDHIIRRADLAKVPKDRKPGPKPK